MGLGALVEEEEEDFVEAEEGRVDVEAVGAGAGEGFEGGGGATEGMAWKEGEREKLRLGWGEGCWGEERRRKEGRERSSSSRKDFFAEDSTFGRASFVERRIFG